MEVILREHVDNLGRRGDVVKVADGYARNFLLPRKLALPVTEQNRKQIERERKVAEARELQERQDAEAVAQKLAAVELVLARRVGENDTLYGSVTSADIADALAEKQFEIEKRKIVLAEPLKQVGEFEVAGEDPPRRAGAREGEDRRARRHRAAGGRRPRPETPGSSWPTAAVAVDGCASLQRIAWSARSRCAPRDRLATSHRLASRSACTPTCCYHLPASWPSAAVLGLYAVFLGIGIAGARKVSGGDWSDLLVAGRAMPLWLAVAHDDRDVGGRRLPARHRRGHLQVGHPARRRRAASASASA